MLLFSDTRAAAVTCAIMKPEFTPLLSTRKAGRPLIFGSTKHGHAALRQAADFRDRECQDIGRERHRFGMKISAGQHVARLDEQQRVVGDGIGFDAAASRCNCGSDPGRRPSPAADSGKNRGPARASNRGARRESRCRRSTPGTRAPLRSVRAGPRTSWMRSSKGASLPFNASTDMAPATTAAANTSSAPNNPASASAVETCVPLIRARPSLARSLRGSSPAKRKPSLAGSSVPRTRTSPMPEQYRAQVRQGRQIPRGAHRALRGNHGIHLMLQQCQQGVDQRHGDAGVSARQCIDLESQDQTHHGIRQRIAHSRGVREQQIALQEFELFRRYAGLRQQAESGIDAVRRIAAWR